MIQPQIYLAISLVELGWIVGALLAVFTWLSIVVLSLTWLERKFLGRLQLRYGPTRTGPFG
ncbi:MAG: NADH-quinone oxidoreductase subunit H, partial [Stenotrophomonas maltophilia]